MKELGKQVSPLPLWSWCPFPTGVWNISPFLVTHYQLPISSLPGNHFFLAICMEVKSSWDVTHFMEHLSNLWQIFLFHYHFPSRLTGCPHPGFSYLVLHEFLDCKTWNITRKLPTVCSLKENFALHCLWMESKFFFRWSLFTPRKPCSPLILNDEQGFLSVYRL